MNKQRLLELAGMFPTLTEDRDELFYEEFMGDVKAAYDTFRELEPFSDDYSEIIAENKSERKEMKNVLMLLGELGKKL